MRIPRVRFTVRRMMVAVAIVALGCAVVPLIYRRYIFLDNLGSHSAAEQTQACYAIGSEDNVAKGRAELEKLSRQLRGIDDQSVRTKFGTAMFLRWHRMIVDSEADAAMYRRRAEYHAAMKAKYRDAAARPWLPVAPDPPGPR